jgi:hypothetical protein
MMESMEGCGRKKLWSVLMDHGGQTEENYDNLRFQVLMAVKMLLWQLVHS